jgi:hypothetical protein
MGRNSPSRSGYVVRMSVHSVAYGSFHHILSSRKFPDHQSRELETLHDERMNREETPSRINPCVPTITSTPSACSYVLQEKKVQKQNKFNPSRR